MSRPIDLNQVNNNIDSPKRILFLYHMNFLDKDCGAKMYVYEIVKALHSKGYLLDYFALNFGNDYSRFKAQNLSEKLVSNFYFFPYEPSQDDKYNFFSWVNDDILNRFQSLINKENYDYIYIHYIQWMDLIKLAEIPENIKIVYAMQDMNFIQEYYKGNRPFDAFMEEVELLKYADEITCISYDEMSFVKKFIFNKNFTYLPHFLQEKKLRESEKDIDVLLLAANNPYNYEGFKWLVEKVCPLLNPDIKITVSGKVWLFVDEDKELLKKVAQYNIERIDFAEDLDEVYSRTKVSVAPIFKGTGLKIKSIDSLSRNVPLVSTLLGVDGFPDKTLSGCLVTDDPTEFANYITKLLQNEDFYKEIQEKSKQYFRNVFLDTINIEKLEKIFQKDNQFKRSPREPQKVAIAPHPRNIVNGQKEITLLPLFRYTKYNQIERYNVLGIQILRIAKDKNITRIKIFGVPLLKIEKKEKHLRAFLFGLIRIYKKEIVKC